MRKSLAQRDARDLVAGDGVEHDQVLGEHRQPADRVGQAELLEHPKHVGTELDAGADLLELGRLLDHLAADAFTRQRQRRRHAANAAADDENRQPIALARHGKPRKFNPFGNDP